MPVPEHKPTHGQFNANSKERRRLRPKDFTEFIGFKRLALTLIYERDAGRCGICRKHVAIDEASFDHIIPRSLGGTLTASNLQLTHLACNQGRRDGRYPAQLRIMDTTGSYTDRINET